MIEKILDFRVLLLGPVALILTLITVFYWNRYHYDCEIKALGGRAPIIKTKLPLGKRV
jgi:hypothetical protein